MHGVAWPGSAQQGLKTASIIACSVWGCVLAFVAMLCQALPGRAWLGLVMRSAAMLGVARAENSVMDGVLSIAMRLAFVAWQCYASHGNARFSGARADNGRQRRLRLPFFFWEMNDR